MTKEAEEVLQILAEYAHHNEGHAMTLELLKGAFSGSAWQLEDCLKELAPVYVDVSTASESPTLIVLRPEGRDWLRRHGLLPA